MTFKQITAQQYIDALDATYPVCLSWAGWKSPDGTAFFKYHNGSTWLFARTTEPLSDEQFFALTPQDVFGPTFD